MQRDSIQNTIIVAVAVCLVCSTAVSLAAIVLRPFQEAEKELFKRKNILQVADRYDGDESRAEINANFEKYIVLRVIDLETGADVTDQYPDGVDQELLSESKDTRLDIEKADDIALIKTRAKIANVYIAKVSSRDDSPARYILPIKGKGLWSILKGFIAIDAKLETVQGITFYEHAETPGLGGEVDNPLWKASWKGKLIFQDDKVAIKVTKGMATNDYEIDGLSGATITSNGVTAMIEYWLGPNGFGNYLDRVGDPSSTTVANNGGGQ